MKFYKNNIIKFKLLFNLLFIYSSNSLNTFSSSYSINNINKTFDINSNNTSKVLAYSNPSIVSASGQGSPSDLEIQHYFLLKQLRATGFTCPNGQTFPPNTNPFAFDCRIWRAATSYAQYMGNNNFFGHIDKEGHDPCYRTTATGLIACSENIAAGQNSAQAALDAFKGSTQHCPNMMNPKLNRIGVGYYYAPSSTYKYYWVQNMGTDNYRGDITCNPPNSQDTINLPIGDSCRDNNDNCKSYQGYAGSEYCNQPWPSSQCKKTCGFCNPTSNPTPNPVPNSSPNPAPNPASNSCVDLLPDKCTAYKGYQGTEYCSTNYGNGWAFTNCKKTCGLC